MLSLVLLLLTTYKQHNTILHWKSFQTENLLFSMYLIIA